ncbi:hypothetical protein AVEN_168694-1 [Araneus ventricosus]|uniref:Uncharacterized protein n=1 Tax=Araneus ventricosus TaxID=182803 RepID=A0A4Y2WDH8_ARAVE|nr:hypothetical protein AVEN_168694-1 [Araneus ventricosus]
MQSSWALLWRGVAVLDSDQMLPSQEHLWSNWEKKTNQISNQRLSEDRESATGHLGRNTPEGNIRQSKESHRDARTEQCFKMQV